MKSRGQTKISPSFGTVIRRRRHQLGWSQEEFAEKAGIHRTYVSSIEQGKVNIGLDVAKNIADGLKVPLSKLIKEAEES